MIGSNERIFIRSFLTKFMSMEILKALKETMTSSTSMNLIKEYAELALDSGLSDGILKDIPVLSTAVGLYKLKTTFSDAQNVRKIAIFINQLQDVPEIDRANLMLKLEESDRFKESMFQKILLVIERLDETAKAEMVGNIFRLYVMEAISRDKFLRLSGIVQRAMLYDLLALHYSESLYFKDREGVQLYHLGGESRVALSAYGLMEQFIEECQSSILEGSGRSGTEPKLKLKVSPLGKELANTMLYDLKDAAFFGYLSEQIRNRRSST